MKVWLLYGVDYGEGVAQDNVLGVFYSKEDLMTYRAEKGVDSDWGNIEYDCFEVLGEPTSADS